MNHPNSTRVVVPEVKVKDDERFRKDVKDWDEELERVKRGGNFFSAKLRVESADKEKGDGKEESKEESNFKGSQRGRIHLESPDWFDGKYVNFNEDQNDSKANFPQSSSPLIKLSKKSYLTEAPSSPQSLHKPVTKPPTSTSPSLTRSSEGRPQAPCQLSPVSSNYFTLLSEEKRLVGQLLLQQYQAAKAKATQSKASRLQVQKRKKALNELSSEEKQQKFLKTKEKIQRAQIKKQHLMMSRAKSK